MDEKTEVREQLRLYFNATQKLIQGQIEYAKGQYDRAIGLLNQAVALNPNDDTIRYNFGVVSGLVREEEQGELKQLEHLVKQTLHKDPEDAEGHLQLAVIYESQQKLVEAAKSLENAINHAPDRADFFLLLGPIYERQERFDEALRTYKRLEQLDSDLPVPILVVMASIYHHKGTHEEALKYAERALQTDGSSWRAHFLLGSIYAVQNLVEKAVLSYQQAIKLAPNELLPYTDLAELHFAQKRYDHALKANNEARRLAPNAQELQEQRSRIQEALRQD